MEDYGEEGSPDMTQVPQILQHGPQKHDAAILANLYGSYPNQGEASFNANTSN